MNSWYVFVLVEYLYRPCILGQIVILYSIQLKYKTES